MSAISIRLATIADAKEISDIHYAALDRYHECYAAFFKTHPRDLLPLMTNKALRNPKMTFLAAVDNTTGKIVGFVRYNIENDSEDKVEEPKTGENPIEPAPTAPFARKEHLEELWKQLSGPREDAMDACREKAAEGKKHYYIVHLMIDPAHQRRGIGNKLLSTVLQKADEEGLPASLTSSAESHGLYLKLGFEDVEEFNIDNADWMRQVRDCEIQNGLPPSDELVAMYDGVTETEHVMVRRARPVQ